MKCRKQFRGHKLPISNLWEVQLDDHIWAQLKRCAYGRNCSFSWITRYCVFRIVRRKHLKLSTAMEKLSSDVKLKYRTAPRAHRHILCLYGEDEKLLRITAMELNMTVSHLIRFALYKYLPMVEKRDFPWWFIYYYGTRITRYLDISSSNFLKLPFVDTIFYTKWPLESWWRRPFGKFIPIPYTPDASVGLSPLYEAILNPDDYDWRITRWKLTR
jgi:hypothetical protein